MKRFLTASIASMLLATAMYSCDTPDKHEADDDSSVEIENTDVVPTGTYTGVAEKVDPDEKEIYVKTTDGKTLELYFKANTTLTRNDQKAEFSELKKGQNVEVTVEKKGDKLEPQTVKIL